MSSKGFAGIRVLRAFRVLRLFKVFKYIKVPFAIEARMFVSPHPPLLQRVSVPCHFAVTK